MPDEKKTEDEGIEAWVTIQLTPPAPGGYFAVQLVPTPPDLGYAVTVRPIAWFALQHLAFEEDGHEDVESRIVPVVLEPDGRALYLDRGEAGGPDHGFAGIAQSAAEAEKIGRAVMAELQAAK